MTKLIVSFRNFAKTPKKQDSFSFLMLPYFGKTINLSADPQAWPVCPISSSFEEQSQSTVHADNPYRTVNTVLRSGSPISECYTAAVPKLFRSTAPSVPYTHPQCPPAFFKKYKCAFVSTFILYLKNRLNKIITVKLNVLCVN
jgi:hypothetical protein